MTKQNEKRAVNIGTNNKFQLQKFALKFMKTYPKDKTAKQYASLLCWDIGVTQRTAFESYIEPMIEHGILIPSGSNCYCFNSEHDYEESFMEQVKKGKIKPRTDVPDS